MRLENFVQIPIANPDSIPKAQKGFMNIFRNAINGIFYGKDSSGLSVAMGSPIIKTKRVSYTWTAQNVIDGLAAVDVVFDTPFADMNYTLVWSPNDTMGTISLDYYNGDIHNKTIYGFTAIVYAFSPGPGYSDAGDVVIVNVIAIHD